MSKHLRERVFIGYDKTKNPIYKWATGSTKQELHANIACLLIQYGVVETDAAHEPQKNKVPTVKSFIQKTYQPTFIDHLTPNTASNYGLYIRLYILPFMGEMRLDEVNVATIQKFYDWMATASTHGRNKNLNETTIRRVGGLVSRIFKVAAEMGLVLKNPVKSTLLHIRAESGGHYKPLPDEEIKRVKSQIPLLENSNERIYMALLAFTGMRPEEVRGLRWEDVSLDEQYAQIKRAVTYPTRNHPFIGATKTKHSVRTVLLPSPLIEILKPLQQVSGFLCGGNEPWCYSTANRISRSAFKHLQIKGFCNYDFRTTYATQLKEYGLSSAIVADLMGHADTRMVETIYAKTRHEGILKQLDYLERLNATKNMVCDKSVISRTP